MKPILVIMAAGMGSRYGGLKQIDPVDEEGDKIIDFSLYDAKRAGFEKAVFVIRKNQSRRKGKTVGYRACRICRKKGCRRRTVCGYQRR